MSNLDTQLARVSAGEIDFGEFVIATRREFRAMAGYLLRRWSGPAWHTNEDVEQDLYLGAWNTIWKDGVLRFDPTRGPTLTAYVVFGAMCHAKRELHKARGVTISGSPDRKTSCFEAPLSSISEGDSLAEFILAEAPCAEELVIRAEEREAAVKVALAACTSPREKIAVLAIGEGGSVDGGARVLYDDLDTRVALRLASEEHAERYVRGAAAAVAVRIAAATN